MLDKSEGGRSSWFVKAVGIFLRRKQWFLVPFVSSIILATGIILFLTQFYESPFFPHPLKNWLEADNVEVTRRSMENLRVQLSHQDAETLQFKQMHKNELASRLKINLRVLGQLHVDLFQIKQGIKGQNNNQENLTDPLAAGLKRKKRLLQDLQKRHPKGHPQIIELKKELQGLEKTVSQRTNSLETPIEYGLSFTALKEREAQLMQNILTYERNIERTPDREAALSVLTNKHNDTLTAYTTLLEKKTSFMPNSFRIGLSGVLFGFLLGIILVVFREKMDRTVRTQDELATLLPAVPIILSVFDYNKVAQNETAKPSAMRAASSSGSSLYGPKTLFLVKDRR